MILKNFLCIYNIYKLLQGCFLDLGKLKPERLLEIKIQVRNNTSHNMQLDVMTRGLPEASSRVVMLPKSFAPGILLFKS
jgi:hypothetical protein